MNNVMTVTWRGVTAVGLSARSNTLSNALINLRTALGLMLIDGVDVEMEPGIVLRSVMI